MKQNNFMSNRFMLSIVGSVLLLLTVVIVALFALFGNNQDDVAKITTTNGKTVVTKDEIERNLSDLDSEIENSIATQEAAEEALSDDSKKVKLGS